MDENATLMRRLPGMLAGRAYNDRDNPHSVTRRGGMDCWLMEYGLSGRAVLKLPGGRAAIEPGTIFTYRPTVPQDYGMAERPGRWDHVWFCFTPRPNWLSLLDWPQAAPGVGLLRVADEQLRRRLEARMIDAVDVYRGPLDRRAEFVMNAIEELLLRLDLINPRRGEARLDPRVRRVMRHICDHPGERLTLDRLAGACGMSPSRLSHLFRSETGLTPMAFLLERRMELARELLAMGRRPIKQISAMAGFESPFYFSRVFRERHGVSPRRFRQDCGGA